MYIYIKNLKSEGVKKKNFPGCTLIQSIKIYILFICIKVR